MNTKTISIAIGIVLLAGIGALYYYLANAPEGEQNLPPIEQIQTQESQDIENENGQENIPPQEGENSELPAVEGQTEETKNKEQTIIGKSVQGRDIVAYHFGAGAKEILFVGGIHGGYAWNTALLAYQLIDRLKNNQNDIPANVKITVIPVLNPDGLAKVVGGEGEFTAGDVSTSADTAMARFNGNNVDLNRNFDCEWQAKAVWQSKTVSGGAAPFSEPESAAIRDYAQSHQIFAVVAWYTSGGGVYSASCNNGVLPEIQTLTNTYAQASGYAAHSNFESYRVSGDMTDWFAKNNTPAIGVLLTAADNTEWTKNWAGCQAVIDHISK